MNRIILFSLLVLVATRAAAQPTLGAEWGALGVGPGQFIDPHGIAVDPEGFVYVADAYNHRIQKFTRDGQFVLMWGGPGIRPGEFDLPLGIAIDHAGNVYVADTGNDRIQKFTTEGGFLLAWGSRGTGVGQFQYPIEVAVDGAGNVFVGDEQNQRIHKFDPAGNPVTMWGGAGSGDGRFGSLGPQGLGASPSVFVWAADMGNSRIQKFGPNGDFLLKWGTSGRLDGQFHRPSDVAVDPTGKVYVAEWGNHRIQVFTNQGQFLSKWGTSGHGHGEFLNPRRIAIDPSGTVFVTQGGLHRVQRWDFGSAAIAAAAVTTEHEIAGSRVISGRIADWKESYQVIPFGWYSDFVMGWWSVNVENRGWFVANYWPGEYEVASAPGITAIQQITDASQFPFSDHSTGPLCDPDCDPDQVGDFVIWRNATSGHYAVARIDDIRGPMPGWGYRGWLDVTWWFQTGGGGDFSGILQPTVDLLPDRCPNIVAAPHAQIVQCAVAGSETFDASRIDPSTVLLRAIEPANPQAALAPAAWHLQDVTAVGTPCDCPSDSSDGFIDLVLDFQSADLVELVGGVSRDFARVGLEAALVDSTFLSGEDCVRIVGPPNVHVPPGRRAADQVATFKLDAPTRVLFVVYDVAGRVVHREESLQPAGEHALAWAGTEQPNGIYLYKIEAGSIRKQGKILRLR